MNAVVYCRVSSKEQVEGTSLESQRLACEEYARARNIRVLRTFIEEGESAKFADRTELLALIEFCRENKGQVNMLLVWKVDRFARNVADHFTVKATLQKYGVAVVSVTEPIDPNPEGKLMETILAGFAQFDNDVRAARTVQGMRRKLQEGIFPWKPPLGYKSPTRTREKKNRPDEPDQPLFGLLQKAWRQFATGIYTKAEIQRLIETWGVVTQRGRPLSAQSLDNLFRNPYYCGVLVNPWSGEEHQGSHIPMVTREEFARVQEIISRRHRSIPHHKVRAEFPLRGLVRCRECNRYLTASLSRGRSKQYPYYHCHNRHCSLRGKALSVPQVNQEFIGYLERIEPKAELLDTLGDLITKSVERREDAAKSARTQRQKSTQRLNEELGELVRMRAQRLISDEEFRSQKSEILSQRHAIEAVPTHSFGSKDIRKHLAEIAAPLSALAETWKTLLPAVRARFQRLIFPVGFITGLIGTAELGLLFRTLGNFGRAKSIRVPLGKSDWNQICREIMDFSEVLGVYHGPERVSGERVSRKMQNQTNREPLEPAA